MKLKHRRMKEVEGIKVNCKVERIPLLITPREKK